MVQSCLPLLADSCHTSCHVLCEGRLLMGGLCWDDACGSKVQLLSC